MGNQPRELELTSYLEPVLCGHAADLAHPAFGKLFLETEHLAGSDALLCRRRPRSARRAAGLGRPRHGGRPLGPGLQPRWGACNTRPTGPGSWAAAARSPIPRR